MQGHCAMNKLGSFKLHKLETELSALTSRLQPFPWMQSLVLSCEVLLNWVQLNALGYPRLKILVSSIIEPHTIPGSLGNRV